MSVSLDELRSLSLQALVELALVSRKDDSWFWYLTGWIWAKLPPDSPSGTELFDAAHTFPGDYQKALKVLQELKPT